MKTALWIPKQNTVYIASSSKFGGEEGQYPVKQLLHHETIIMIDKLLNTFYGEQPKSIAELLKQYTKLVTQIQVSISSKHRVPYPMVRSVQQVLYFWGTLINLQGVSWDDFVRSIIFIYPEWKENDLLKNSPDIEVKRIKIKMEVR